MTSQSAMAQCQLFFLSMSAVFTLICCLFSIIILYINRKLHGFTFADLFTLTMFIYEMKIEIRLKVDRTWKNEDKNSPLPWTNLLCLSSFSHFTSTAKYESVCMNSCMDLVSLFGFLSHHVNCYIESIVHIENIYIFLCNIL